MSGYGEFKWKDGKRYLGYYLNDKKEGFGIYYWTSSGRAYIGFWKKGKQDGVGKYINNETTRFGLWRYGERLKWFENEKEILEHIPAGLSGFKKIFKFDINDIQNFLS
jgi:hypothetical protein